MIKVTLLFLIQVALVFGLTERLLIARTGNTTKPSSNFRGEEVTLEQWNLDDGSLQAQVNLTATFNFTVTYGSRQGALTISQDGYWCMYGINAVADSNLIGGLYKRMILYGTMPLDVLTVSTVVLPLTVQGLPYSCYVANGGIYTADSQRGVYYQGGAGNAQIWNENTVTYLQVADGQLYVSSDNGKVTAVGTGLPTTYATQTTTVVSPGIVFGFKFIDRTADLLGVDTLYTTSIGSIFRYTKPSDYGAYAFDFPLFSLNYAGAYYAIDGAFNSTHINLFTATVYNDSSKILRWSTNPGQDGISSFFTTTLMQFPQYNYVCGLALWFEPVVTGVTTGLTTGLITTGAVTTGALTTGLTTGVTTGVTTGRTTGITTGAFTTGQFTTGVTTGITSGVTTGVTSGVTTQLITTGPSLCASTPETTYYSRFADCSYPANSNFECVQVSTLFSRYPGRDTVTSRSCAIWDCSSLDRTQCTKITNKNNAICYFPNNKDVCYQKTACPNGVPSGWGGKCDRFYDISFTTADCVSAAPAVALVPLNSNSASPSPSSVCHT